MPTKSAKQERFMQAVANNPKFAKTVGVPTKVGKEFTKSGDDMASKMNPGFMAMMKKKAPAKKMAMGGPSNPGSMPLPKKPGSMSMPPRDIGTGGNPNPRRAPLAQAINKPGMMKKGGVIASKMGAVKTAAPSKDGVAVKGKTKGKMIAMAKGGKTMKSGGKTC